MVYATAARKTLGYLVVAGVLGLAAVTLFMGDVGAPTAHVVAESNGVDGIPLLGFCLGLVTGALIVGTYVYVAHIETKR